MSGGGGERVVAIDVLKGCAILGVLLIHSEALGPHPVFRHVVNHAVPIFIILFGVNSTFWWRRRALPADLGTWVRTRARRIVLPLWGILPVWWLIALWYRPFGVFFPWWLPIAHLLGYTLYIGTGWFVTLVIQLVAAFPALEALRRGIGAGGVMAASTPIAAAMIALRLEIVARLPETWLGFPFFNYLILAPRFFAHVAFGMWLAGRLDVLRPATALVATVVAAACAAAVEYDPEAELGQYTRMLMDVPLCVALLVAVAPLARVPGLGRGLVWLGQSSYGIYIGQMLTHNACTFHYGLLALHEHIDRWTYTAVLLAGGVLAVWVGEAVLALSARCHAAGWPVPDLSR